MHTRRSLSRAAGLLAVIAALGCDDASTEAPAPDQGVTADAGADMATDAGTPLATPAEIAAATDLTRYAEHLEFVARVRAPGSAHWRAVQDRCADTFEAAGFTVERHTYLTGTNVIGVLPGTATPDEAVLLGAHYDHVPGCAGADDNASGVAGVLDAAEALGGRSYARTIVVACFDEEEWSHLGAAAWAQRHASQGRTVAASLHFEMIGYRDATPSSQTLPAGFDVFFADAGAFVADRDARADFIAAVGDDINPAAMAAFAAHAEAFELPVAEVALPAAFRADPSLRDLQRGDHAEFWAQGWPAIMLTDTGDFRNPGYHCEWQPDDIASVDVGFAHQTVQAATAAIAELAQPSDGAPAALDWSMPADPSPLTPACDIVAQDCGADLKCAAVLRDGVYTIECVDAPAAPIEPGPPGVADECTRVDGTVGLDDCAAGSICTFWSEARGTPQRRSCRPLCAADTDCEGGTYCAHLFRRYALGACASRCSPADPESCPDGRCVTLGNVYNRDQTSFLCLPRPEGARAEGEPCSVDDPCANGLRCLAARGTLEPICTRWCATSDDCNAGENCQSAGYAGEGWCQPVR